MFPKKTRAEISRKTHRRMPRDLSYETDSGPKTKTDKMTFSGDFQMTAAAAAISQELSLTHHAQGPNIPFGESLTSTIQRVQRVL